ncbi:PREDICTED: MATH and LRR domain-containing protein PFE0570w [Nicrophorus vespilloides]|uniref:MATH and LRR domain-containing protein PFE0570w n=1 Tax=Nicrophorus vespilloides TaxID=110193 RepID=A0ABM1N0B8_NICVS|nr:PREDICTED: MATH and LRR domain-containing protein PFE0570w [Nicrophorus vespilloides]
MGTRVVSSNLHNQKNQTYSNIMDSQLTNNKKSLRRSVRVITPDQIKKLGLDVTLRNLINRQTGSQNGEGKLEKAANNNITEAKLKISIHKSNNIDEKVPQQVIESGTKSVDSVDASQKSSRRISNKNVNIIKATRNRANLKGNYESEDNCKGEESPSRKLRSNTKADNIVKPQDVDVKNADKNVDFTDKINLKETKKHDLLTPEDISTQPTVPIEDSVANDNLENINLSEVADIKKSESLKERDINYKENEDIVTNSESLKNATTDGANKIEENRIKLPSVTRKKRISSEAVNKIKLSRNNNKKKEIHEFENVDENVAKEKPQEKDEISSVKEQSLTETPSKPNLNKTDTEEPSKIDVSGDSANENISSIDLPSVSRKKRISSEALNKLKLSRNNKKKEIHEFENVHENVANQETQEKDEILCVEEQSLKETPSKPNLNKTDTEEPSKIDVSGDSVNENISSIDLPSVSRKKRISSEALNKINLRRNNNRKKETLDFENVDEKALKIDESIEQKEIKSSASSNIAVIDKPTKIAADEQGTLEEDIRKDKPMEMIYVEQDQSIIETPSKSQSLNNPDSDTPIIAVTEKDAKENVSNLRSGTRKKRISSEALNKIHLRRNNNSIKERLEVENVDENIIRDESSCIEQKDQSVIETPSKSTSLNSIVTDVTTKMNVVEKGLNENASKINLPSISRKKKISSEALNKINARRSNSKKKEILELKNDNEVIVKETPMEVDSPCKEIKVHSLNEIPSESTRLNNEIIDKSTEIAVIEENIKENTSNIDSPSLDRKKRVPNLALNKINSRRNTNKHKDIHELDKVDENIETEKQMEMNEISCVKQHNESLIETPSTTKICADNSTEITVVEMGTTKNTSKVNLTSASKKKRISIINSNRRVEALDTENDDEKCNSVIRPNIENTEEVESSDDDNRLVIDENTSNDKCKLTESEENVGLNDSINLNISCTSSQIIIESKNQVEAKNLNDSSHQNNSTEINKRSRIKEQVETKLDLNNSSNLNNSNNLEKRRRSTRQVNNSNATSRTSKRNSISKTKDIVVEAEIQNAKAHQINEAKLEKIKLKSENKKDNAFLKLEDDKVSKKDDNINNRGDEQPNDLVVENANEKRNKIATGRKKICTSENKVTLEGKDILQCEEMNVKRSKRTSVRRKEGDKSINEDSDCKLQQPPLVVLSIDDTFSENIKSKDDEPEPEIKGTCKKVSERIKDTMDDTNAKVSNTKLKESLIKSGATENEVNVSVNEINKCDKKRFSGSSKVTPSRKNANKNSSNDNEIKPVQKKITDFLIFKEKPKPDIETNVAKCRKRKASIDIIECESDEHDDAAKNKSVNDETESKNQIDNTKGLKTRSKKAVANIEDDQIKNKNKCTTRKSKRVKSEPDLFKGNENEMDKETNNVAEPDTANVINDKDTIALNSKGNKRKRSNIDDFLNPTKKLKENSSENVKNDEVKSIFEIYNTGAQHKKLTQHYSSELKLMYAELLKKPGRKFGKISGTVVCALCDQSFNNSLWTTHKLKHNNLAWRVGEQPLSLEPPVITNILNAMYKGRNKLCCHRCNETKKSVFGFLCHFVACGKSEQEVEEMKVTCEVCATKILPYLYWLHYKIHMKPEKTEPITTEDNDITTESPYKSRVAAKKANAMIKSVSNYLNGADDRYFVKNVFKKSDLDVVLNKEISSKGFVLCPFDGCEAKMENVDKIITHFEECTYKPEEVYMCKKCFHYNKVRADMINHVQVHQKKTKRKNDDGEFNANASDSSEDSDNEDNNKSITTNKSKNNQSVSKSYKFAFLGQKYNKSSLYGALCNRNYVWMLQFCKDNFNDKKIFMKFAFSSKYVNAMDPVDISNYLPTIKRSINMQQNIIDFCQNEPKLKENCKKYKLFETESNQTSTNIYCGGPISATTWAPTPYDSDTYNQVLAVALNLDAEKRYTFSEINTDKGLLQFWSFGNLNSRTLKDVLEPELAFCIGHNYGYVTCMEWCPSGCYDEDRLGLLCICCSDSFVYGLSVSQPSRVTSKMLNAKPAFKFSLNKWRDMDLGDCNFHPTTISWSKSAGHKYIAIGYSNGVVALFDLSTESELLRMEIDDLPVYFPYKTFLAHTDAVTGLQLFHLNGGNRWLVTGSNDRMVKFWDLQQTVIPIYINQRTYVSQLLWLINYVGTIDAHKDFLSSLLQSTTVSHIREFAGSVNNVLMYSGTSVNSISCNEWSSIIVQGNEMGEVIGCHFNNFFSNAPPKRFYISNIGLEGKLATVNKDTTVYPTYKDVCDNFNAVSNDYDMKYYLKVIRKSEALVGTRGPHSSPKPNIFPIQAVTQISVNPNRHSYYYTAAGYKLGFVKIFKMRMFQSN